MRHLQTIVTFIVLMTSLVSFAKDDGKPKSSGHAPILEVSNNPDNSVTATTQFGDKVRVTIDPTAAPKANPSFFSRLRQEINKLEMQEASKNQGEGTEHVLRHVKANFVPDSITFAIAGGLVYFVQLQAVTHSDPALMVKHLESLKDPIAHISFGAFMVANGMYIDMRTRGLDPMTKQLAMKRLTYSGLAAGSFASSVTADLLVTMKECTKGWINNRNDAASHAMCDSAFSQWTKRNKYVGYATQIMSLLVTQKATDVVESVVAGGGRYVVKPVAKALESSAMNVLKLTAANVDLVFSGRTWWIKGIQWLGKLSKFSMFLAVDHYVSPHVNRAGNDLLQPTFFYMDAMALGKSMALGSKYHWDPNAANNAKESFDAFPKQILKFTEQMATWRMHLNAKAEADLSGWLEVSSKLLHQIDYAKNYYLKYVENSYDTFHRQNLVNKGEYNDDPSRAWALERRYPQRILPLYGVKSDFKFEGEVENDVYLSKPFLIEEKQTANVQKLAAAFLPKLNTFGMSAEQLTQLKDLILPLTKPLSPIRQGIQLDKINRALKFLPFVVRGTPANQDPHFAVRSALNAFRAALGNPMPQLKEGSGYNMAFDTNVGIYQAAKAAGFDLKERNYAFAKTSDLMLFNMICGGQKAIVKEGMLTGINFYPPRMVSYNGELEFCKNTWIQKNLTSINFHDFKIQADGKTYENPTQFVMSRMYKDVLGNTQDEFKESKGVAFDKWWVTSILPGLQAELKKLDERYGQVVAKAEQQINNQKSWYDKAIDGLFTGEAFMKDSLTLDANVGDNLRFEFEFYLSTMKLILMNEKLAPQAYNHAYIYEISKKARAGRGVIPAFDADKALADLKKNYPLMFNMGSEGTTEDVTTLDDYLEKVLAPVRKALEAEGEKLSEAQKKNPPKAFTDKLAYLEKVKQSLLKARINEFENAFKTILKLLSEPNLTFDQMVKAREKIYSSKTALLGPYKQMAELAGLDMLDKRTQSLVALDSGLEALEIEVNRFLLMKVKLVDRLQIDMSQLNTYLKYRSIAPGAKQGSASPHSTGSSNGNTCTTILSNGVCKKN